MCGFFLTSNKDLSPSVYNEALDTLKSRGPDEQNIIRSTHFVAGHTRLSIQDLDNPNAVQPYYCLQSKLTVLFNGEIWNFPELLLDHSLCLSHDSSEVQLIAALYSVYGPEFIRKLDGMFAIVLFDHSSLCTHIYRDQLGRKPLFYSLKDNDIYISSLCSTLHTLGIVKSVSESVLLEICSSRHLQYSFYSGIHEVKPGSYITFHTSTSQIELNQYFQLTDLFDYPYHTYLSGLNQESLLSHLSSLLDLSISRRITPAVNGGCILSGGIDSSLLAFKSRHENLPFLHLNSIDSSELSYAQQVADQLSSSLQVEEIDYSTYANNIIPSVLAWEYPLVHSNGVGIKLLGELANRLGIKYLLGGEGADELFGGYDHYKKLSLLSALPIPQSLLEFSVYIKSALNYPSPFNPSAISPSTASRFLFYQQTFDFYRSFFSDRSAFLHSIQILDLADYLQPLLSRADRLMMSESVELRMPFLDLDVLRFAINLPLSKKFNSYRTKILLKQLFARYYPDIPVSRKKVGFTIDYYSRWISDYGSPYLDHVSDHFNCRSLIDFYISKNRFDLLTRIATISPLL